MQSLHGNFSIHRTTTVDGLAAIMVVPNPVSELPMSFSWDDAKDESAELSFADVQGGNFLPNEYVTLVYANDYKISLPPYVPTVTKM